MKSSMQWRIAVRTLRDAYEASRKPLVSALMAAEHDFRAALSIDNTIFVDYPTDPVAVVHQQNLEITTYDQRFALKVVTHGFVVSLYHLWERQSREWVGWEHSNYHHGTINGLLKAQGIPIDPGIHKLRKLTNCLKHDSDELWKSNPELFDPHVKLAQNVAKRVVYSLYVKVSHDLMIELFTAALASGPQPPRIFD